MSCGSCSMNKMRGGSEMRTSNPRLGPAIALAGLLAAGTTGMYENSSPPVPAPAVIPHIQFEAELNSFEPWQEFIAPDGSHRLCSPNTAAHVCNGLRGREQGLRALEWPAWTIAMILPVAIAGWRSTRAARKPS